MKKSGEKFLNYPQYIKSKKLKIDATLNYFDIELDKLKKVKEAKLYRENLNKIVQKKLEENQKHIEKIRENIRFLEEIIEYLRQLFLYNYFLPSNEEEEDNIDDDFLPSNWGRLPINVLGKYDDGDDLWINDDNEWEKALHGTGRHCKTDEEIKEMIDSIVTHGFKSGVNNVHENGNDILHPGKKIGKGVYVTPKIDIAKKY